MFVQYKGLAYVADLFAQEAQHQLEKLQQEIVPHLDKLLIFDKDVKRVIKQLKLPKDTDLVELGKSIILSATRGEDTGLISCDEDDIAYGIGHLNGHYYCFANDTYEVWLNSESFRIYKVKKV